MQKLRITLASFTNIYKLADFKASKVLLMQTGKTVCTCASTFLFVPMSRLLAQILATLKKD